MHFRVVCWDDGSSYISLWQRSTYLLPKWCWKKKIYCPSSNEFEKDGMYKKYVKGRPFSSPWGLFRHFIFGGSQIGTAAGLPIRLPQFASKKYSSLLRFYYLAYMQLYWLVNYRIVRIYAIILRYWHIWIHILYIDCLLWKHLITPVQFWVCTKLLL